VQVIIIAKPGEEATATYVDPQGIRVSMCVNGGTIEQPSEHSYTLEMGSSLEIGPVTLSSDDPILAE
jgi:hypothetical protein